MEGLWQPFFFAGNVKKIPGNLLNCDILLRSPTKKMIKYNQMHHFSVMKILSFYSLLSKR
jgi:hypothetical protein